MWLELTIPAWNALCRQHPWKIDPYMVCVAYLTEAASLSSDLVQLFSIFFCLSKQPRIFFILLVTVYASFPSISSFDMSELTQNLYFNDLVALFTYAYFSKPSPITGISLPVLAYPYSVHTCLCPWKLKNKSTTAPSTYSLVDLSSLSNYLLDLNHMDIPVLHRYAKMNSFL